MARLYRRITISALSGAANGTKITTANSVGGLTIPQKSVSQIWIRQLNGISFDWRVTSAGGAAYTNAIMSVPNGEQGLIDDITTPSTPDMVELFLPSGQTDPIEVQLAIDYASIQSLNT